VFRWLDLYVKRVALIAIPEQVAGPASANKRQLSAGPACVTCAGVVLT
jgi:hypothetical protein